MAQAYVASNRWFHTPSLSHTCAGPLLPMPRKRAHVGDLLNASSGGRLSDMAVEYADSPSPCTTYLWRVTRQHPTWQLAAASLQLLLLVGTVPPLLQLLPLLTQPLRCAAQLPPPPKPPVVEPLLPPVGEGPLSARQREAAQCLFFARRPSDGASRWTQST